MFCAKQTAKQAFITYAHDSYSQTYEPTWNNVK